MTPPPPPPHTSVSHQRLLCWDGFFSRFALADAALRLLVGVTRHIGQSTAPKTDPECEEQMPLSGRRATRPADPDASSPQRNTLRASVYRDMSKHTHTRTRALQSESLGLNPTPSGFILSPEMHQRLPERIFVLPGPHYSTHTSTSHQRLPLTCRHGFGVSLHRSRKLQHAGAGPIPSAVWDQNPP